MQSQYEKTILNYIIMNKYFLFCNDDFESKVIDCDFIGEDLLSIIEDNLSEFELFKWVDMESKPEDLLFKSHLFQNYIILSEEEYEKITEIILRLSN